MYKVYMIKKTGGDKMFLNSYKTKQECEDVICYLLNNCNAGKTIRFEVHKT